MAFTVTCPLCSQSIDAADQEALIAAADAHGDEAHGGMHAPRELILANATET